MNRTLPPWLTIRAPKPGTVEEVERLISGLRLHTVCQSARCPNLAECWSRHTATFMILGAVCTRNCRFCAVSAGAPTPVDPEEPRRVAEAARQLGLRHVVVTSVTRDDLPDGGAHQFADVILAIRDLLPEASVEVLTPDFQGDPVLVDIVASAHPQVFNHNVETVPRLYPSVRPQAIFARSVGVLAGVKRRHTGVFTKSGIMVGLGETESEVVDVMQQLREADVDALTIGQYLRPTTAHHPVVEYVTPDQFDRYRQQGEAMGFLSVASQPFVRSSYNAQALTERLLERDNRAGPQ